MQYQFYLVHNAQRLALPTEPLGWEEVRFELSRDNKWQGVLTTFVGELIFICEAKTFIESIYHTLGVEAVVYLEIYGICETVDLLYRGRLDLATLQWNAYGGLTCMILDGGAGRTLLNRISLKVNLLANETVGGLALNPLPPLALLDNENGLPIRAQLVADWNGLTAWGQDLDGFPTNLGGAVCTTAVGKLGILSCADDSDVVDSLNNEHLLQYYLTPGWDTLYNELKEYTAPVLDFGNYTENECDGLGINDSAERPPVLLKALAAGSYHLQTCVCGRFVVWVSTDGRESCASGRTNDFEGARVRFVATVNDGPPIELTAAPAAYLAPNILSNDLTRCDGGVFNFDLPGDIPHYLDTELCFEIDTQIDLAVGDELRIFVLIDVKGRWLRPDFGACICAFFYGCLSEVCCLRLSLDSRVTYANSQIVGIMVQEAGARLAQSVTDNAITFYSDYFGRADGMPYPTVSDGCGSRLFLTNGLNIRQFPAQLTTLPPPDTCGYGTPESVQATLFLSIQELLDGLDALHNIGFELTTYQGQTVLRIEPKEYFYQNNILLVINDLDLYESEYSCKVRFDLYYSEFSGGYRNWESESVNGLLEYNSARNWRTGLATSPNRLERVCDFVGSGYTFERVRRKPFAEFGSTDDPFDHQIFILCTEQTDSSPGIYYAVTAEKGAEPPTNEILFPTECYNFRIRPRANAVRWANVLAVGGYPQYIDPVLVYNDGSGNAFAAGGDPLTGLCNLPYSVENQAINLFEARSPVVLIPEEIQFRYPISFATFNAIRQQPYGRIIVNGFPYYILSLRYLPNDRSEFSLIKAKI